LFLNHTNIKKSIKKYYINKTNPDNLE